MPEEYQIGIYWQQENTIMVFACDFKAIYHFGMKTMKSRRKALHLTQAAVAEKAGTSQPQIQRLENNERELTRAWAERLAPALQTSAVYLVFPELEESAGDAPAELQVRSALLAYGVHRDELPAVMKAIKGFLEESDGGDEPPQSDLPRDLSGPASPHHGSTPSRKKARL